jgi:hypothetical protein
MNNDGTPDWSIVHQDNRPKNIADDANSINEFPESDVESVGQLRSTDSLEQLRQNALANQRLVLSNSDDESPKKKKRSGHVRIMSDDSEVTAYE